MSALLQNLLETTAAPMQASAVEQPDPLIPVGDVLRLLGLKSRMTIHRRLRDPDSAFPRPYRVGANSVRWRLSEIEAYRLSLPRVSYRRMEKPNDAAA